MEIFNIGPLEFLFILVLMILLLGPEGMKRGIWQIGKWVREARQSALWKDIRALIRETQDLPVRLVREAGFDEQIEEIHQIANSTIDLYDTPARLPGKVPSPGKRRLRPPHRPGQPQAARSQSPDGETTETSSVETTPDNSPTQ